MTGADDMNKEKWEILKEFDILRAFKLHEVSTSLQNGNEILCFEFINEKNVAINVFFIDGNYKISEPYAIDNENLRLEKEQIKFKGDD